MSKLTVGELREWRRTDPDGYAAYRQRRDMEQMRNDVLRMEAQALADRLRALYTAEALAYTRHLFANNGRARGFDMRRAQRIERLRDRAGRRVARRWGYEMSAVLACGQCRNDKEVSNG